MAMEERVLWRPLETNGQHNASAKLTPSQRRLDEEREFHRVRNHLRHIDDIAKSQNDNPNDGGHSPSLVVATPPQRPLMDLMGQSLVVAQEVALSAILVAVHREIVTLEEGQESMNRQLEMGLSGLSQNATVAILSLCTALFATWYCTQQSTARYQEQRGMSAYACLPDELLRAAKLWTLSRILCALSAYYSCDKVYPLVASGMAVHLLACGYSYANGVLPADSGAARHRALFFSTALLASMIRSNTASFAFLSLVVMFYAFYPAWRHSIVRSSPNSATGSSWAIIALALTLAAWILMSSFEKIVFASLQLLVLVVSPCAQWRLQRHKRIITGPWDIAHIDVST